MKSGNGSEVDELTKILIDFGAAYLKATDTKQYMIAAHAKDEAKAKLNTLIHRARLEGAIEELELVLTSGDNGRMVSEDGVKDRLKQLKEEQGG